MATSRIAPVTDFEVESGESAVELEFVDEDDLPLSCVRSGNNFLEHPESDEEVDSDFLSDSSGSEGDEAESEEYEEVETVESIWTEELTRRTDIDFDQSVGMAVDPASLNSSKDFFELLFTDQVWQLLVTQTNLYAEQKRGAEQNSVWYPVSVVEMKAWLALYLCMGIVNKLNIKSYWSTDPILSTPFFPVLCQERGLFRFYVTFILLITTLPPDLTHQTITNYTKFNLFLILWCPDLEQFITLRGNLLFMRL